VKPGNIAGSGYNSLQSIVKRLRDFRKPDRLGYHVRNIAANLSETSLQAYKRYVKPPLQRIVLGLRAEQIPNPESRVLLDDSVDCFGKRRLRLEWRLSAQDYECFQRAKKILRNALAHDSSDRYKLLPDDSEQPPGCGVPAGGHHMGTTRMHRNLRLGVVDENCKVHGLQNLYIAGSSVFPTYGWAPPTLTIIALALRLSDHLKARLRSK
jgi:choline dehydrogenase-like flavoprotein